MRVYEHELQGHSIFFSNEMDPFYSNVSNNARVLSAPPAVMHYFYGGSDYVF